jgi:hypothetical protein
VGRLFLVRARISHALRNCLIILANPSYTVTTFSELLNNMFFSNTFHIDLNFKKNQINLFLNFIITIILN